MTNPDVIIVGAGHNGLVAAAYLAKAGKRVLVVEARETPGGQLARAISDAGFEAAALHAGGSLRPEIVRDLDLTRHGLVTTVPSAAPSAAAPAAPSTVPSSAPAYVSILPDGGTLRLTADAADATTLESIGRLSVRDAGRWPEFVAFMNAAAGFLDAAYRTPIPAMTHEALRGNALPLASLALKLRRLGRRDMFRVIRSLSMSAREFTEEWFEAEPLRAAIGALAIHGVTLGSMSAGTGFTLIHNWLNRGGLAHRPAEGGLARITDALVATVQARGGQVRTAARVSRILVDKQRVLGVELASGEELRAGTVISAADPRRTLLGLVGAPELPPEFVWRTQSIRMRGSVAKVFVLTEGRHGLPDGTLAVAPSLEYLERAYDAAKYGEVSDEPYLEVTTSGELVTIHFQFAPYRLRDGNWHEERARVEQLAIDTLSKHVPAFAASVRKIRSLTPFDLERDWGSTEGDLNHGQLALDQMFFMRPLPGWSHHGTPIDGLYLCGSGVHGGGGVSGAAGRNAARAVLGARTGT